MDDEFLIRAWLSDTDVPPEVMRAINRVFKKTRETDWAKVAGDILKNKDCKHKKNKDYVCTKCGAFLK